ncbi:MAG: hypothetical protein IJU12_07460 [Clostridia bacterium]|nr:hypothetical protein [Clostridia bacterium]
MADFWKLLGAAVACAVMALTLRTAHRPMAAVFSLAAGAVLLGALLDPLRQAVELLQGIAAYAPEGREQLALMLKLLGVSFAAEFAAQACRDAGEDGIALRVELSAKVMLVILAAPLLRQLAGMILELTA